ncbi:MAG: hypothetical protein COB04_10875 [Gammaproteobacteria bacterium]|nr:MAG: hypothetical protein COB04_10875 [Gammaproteobacteria bacterium]
MQGGVIALLLAGNYCWRKSVIGEILSVLPDNAPINWITFVGGASHKSFSMDLSRRLGCWYVS